MNNRTTAFYFFFFPVLLLVGCTGLEKGKQEKQTTNEKEMLAERPPMGWNSWICFGTSVTESEVKENADFMATHLKAVGWEYIVIDAGWYAPQMVTLEQYEAKNPPQLIDEYGRLIIDTDKYPSAKSGEGLKPLSDYIHSKGLKLGIHIMRGIPIQAVEQNTPIKGTTLRARDIVNPDSQCKWYFGFYGIDMSKPGAQAYYDSLFELYDSWGIDYVKVDDLLSPVYAYDEIQAVHNAVQKMNRPVLLSLSPGPAPVENVKHLQEVSQMWRISEDFWDNWESLKQQFPLCRKWQHHVKKGHWPDADMLPIGPLAQRAMRGKARPSHFTPDEQYTLMTLWTMFRSPLMLGCNLPEMDEFTLKLITNQEVMHINQHSKNNRELFEKEGIIAWYAESEQGEACYVALFNTTDAPLTNYTFSLQQLQLNSITEAVELWQNETLILNQHTLQIAIPPHGAKLIKLQNKQ